jgi:hypothetical protein
MGLSDMYPLGLAGSYLLAGFPRAARHSQAGLLGFQGKDQGKGMHEFSATDAAFEGFRVARERPRAILAWAAVAVVMGLAQWVLVATIGGQALNEFLQASESGVTDPNQVLALYADLAPFLAAAIPLTIVFNAVMSAAAYRVVLEPQTAGTGLRFGAQEFRQAALLVIVGLVLFLVNLGVLFVVAIVVGTAMQLNSAIGAALASLAFLAWFLGFTYMVLRLSLAGPQTFAERHIRPFASWGLTRGHVWRMAGAYLLAIAFAMIVLLLGMVILSGLVAVAGGSPAELVKPVSGVAGYFTPVRIVYLIGWSIIATLIRAILLCPAAVIYRQIHEPSA